MIDLVGSIIGIFLVTIVISPFVLIAWFAFKD